MLVSITTYNVEDTQKAHMQHLAVHSVKSTKFSYKHMHNAPQKTHKFVVLVHTRPVQDWAGKLKSYMYGES